MRWTRSILCLGLIAAVTGCSSTYDQAVLRGETFTINSPYVVLDTDELTEARANTKTPSSSPWWMTRNDHRLNIRPDGNAATATTYVIRVDDYQRHTDEKVHDYYRRHFQGYTYGQTAP